jgi:hypothetical protein
MNRAGFYSDPFFNEHYPFHLLYIYSVHRPLSSTFSWHISQLPVIPRSIFSSPKTFLQRDFTALQDEALTTSNSCTTLSANPSRQLWELTEHSITMVPFSYKTALSCLACLSLLLSGVRGHTWVELLNIIDSNGTFTGTPGYPRGLVPRNAPNFGDPLMTNRIPPADRVITQGILPTDPMCMSSQTIGNQTPGFPALTASPGDMVALRYQENGHVSLPQTQLGKPANRGTVFVYGTTQPKNTDTLLGIHKQWTADGKGGDGRGVLLATRNYDDGQCYQVNGGAISVQRQAEFKHTATPLMGGDLWCQTDITLPVTIDSKSYTVYWVWDWPTLPGIDPGLPNGKNETYTTCMDINISQTTGNNKAATKVDFIQGQDLNFAAVESQMTNSFQVSVSGATAAATQAAQATTSSPVSVATTSAQANGAVATVTNLIHDTVTQYSTAQPTANAPAPLTQGTDGSIIIPGPAATASNKPVTPAAASPIAQVSAGSIVVSAQAQQTTSSQAQPTTLAAPGTSSQSQAAAANSPASSGGRPVVSPFYTQVLTSNAAVAPTASVASGTSVSPSTTSSSTSIARSTRASPSTTLVTSASLAPTATFSGYNATVTNTVNVAATHTVYVPPQIRGRAPRL